MLINSHQSFVQDRIREIWQNLSREAKLNVGETERVGSLFGGVLLTLYGLSRRMPLGLGFIAAAGYLLYRGLTGYCPAYEAVQVNTACTRLRFDDEYNEQPETTVDMDDIYDEAVWQTFPASDPPSSW